MEDDERSLTLTGEAADAVRSAAREAGTSPEQWVLDALAPRRSRGADALAGQPPQPEPRSSLADPVKALARPGGWEVVTEPGGTFTVELPQGWQHQVATVPRDLGPSRVFNSHSPDGGTTIYGNDPDLLPRQTGFGSFFSGGNPRGEPFAGQYVTGRFGRMPGFRILGTRTSAPFAQLMQRSAQRSNAPLAWLDAVEIAAEFQQDGRRMTVAALVGAFEMPMVWSSQVMLVVSDAEAIDYVPALLHMYDSFKLTAAGQQAVAADQAMRQQAHQATMNQIQASTAAMTAGHQQRMSSIQTQGAAFQAQMRERQEVFDQGVDSWRAQQAASDRGHAGYMAGMREQPSYGAAAPEGSDHRTFINTMKEEETVVDRDGWEHQVEAGPDKWYYNKHQEKFIGLDQHDDIHDVPGINPDDWDETPIQR